MTYETFRDSLQDLRGAASADDEMRTRIHAAATALRALSPVTRKSVAAVVEQHPDWVPALATCVGLSHEELKNQLRYLFGTSGYIRLARERPLDLVTQLDQGFNLIKEIKQQRTKRWTFGDVLYERYASRSRAGSAIRRGRSVENVVEDVVKELKLPYVMRARFEGRGGRDGPCDFAIPGGGKEAKIVGCAKGFNSTGSKLSDAVREIREMADVRRPNQFVFAVIDGIGWLGRDKDLRRIYEAWESNDVDGLYSLATIADLQVGLRDAARRLSLLP